MSSSLEATRREPVGGHDVFMQIENLSVSYHGKPALSNINLPLHRHCITALVGPSGCGKSSLLNALTRLTDLIPGTCVEGRITLEDENILSPATDLLALRSRIGMIFQQPRPFPFSIRRNFEIPLREHGVRKRSHLEERMRSALEDVGLWEEVKHRLDHSAEGLSGGQQQRLCIARALALQPRALLLDEPCSALDPMATATIEALLVRLKRQISVVVVTHNLAQARRIADYVAVFWHREQGELLEHGAAEEIFRQPGHILSRRYLQGLSG